MTSTNNYPGLYKYEHLPLLAKFILDGHLYDFAAEQLQYARKHQIPLLSFLSHLSDEQLLEITVTSLKEILRYLVDNNVGEQISTSTHKWLSNQLEVVGKHDVVAEDITLLYYVRGKSLKNFAFQLYGDKPQLQELLSEIDDFLLASTTTAINTYITLMQGRIEEEEEFRSRLSNALPGFIYVYDVYEKIQRFSNDKLKDILGYTTEMMMEMSKDFYHSVTHPEDWEKTLECRAGYSTTDNSICSFECRVKDFHGHYKWIRYYETTLRRENDGAVREVIGVAFDVSGQKEISEALLKSERELLEAQSIAHIGSFEWYIQGDKSTTNTPEIYRIFEMEQMEKFEQFMQYVHREDLPKVENAIKLSFETGTYECIYRYLRNGKEKIIWSKGVVTIEDGRPVTMSGTVQDVTAIKRIEGELKQKTIELQNSNESLQQFAAIASHDLKEPLRKISVFSSKVLNADKDKLTEASYAALTKIFDSAVRMQSMIDDILQFSFIDANQQYQETDLEALLFEVKELLSEAITAKMAVITTDKLPVANVIAPQIRQLFQNLVSNALKFSKQNENPKIRVTHTYIIDRPTATTVNRQLQLCIEDNGIGFDNKDSEKVFGLFYRLHNRSQFEGTGLGLSICKKIVDKHSGTITVESKIGVGSKFIIRLPV